MKHASGSIRKSTALRRHNSWHVSLIAGVLLSLLCLSISNLTVQADTTPNAAARHGFSISPVSGPVGTVVRVTGEGLVIGGGQKRTVYCALRLSTASPHKGWSFRGAFSWSPPRRLSAVLVILFSLPSAHTTAFGSQWTKIRQIRQHRSQQVYRSAPLSMYPEKALLSAGPLPTPT